MHEQTTACGIDKGQTLIVSSLNRHCKLKTHMSAILSLSNKSDKKKKTSQFCNVPPKWAHLIARIADSKSNAPATQCQIRKFHFIHTIMQFEISHERMRSTNAWFAFIVVHCTHTHTIPLSYSRALVHFYHIRSW